MSANSGSTALLAPVPGVLLAAMHASAGELGLICPAVQGGEAAWAGEVEVIAAPDLLALINHLKGTQLLSPPVQAIAEIVRRGPDLGEIKGQETAKRALEIAAAGGHNLLMSGPPGSGKSLLAAALPGILPELTRGGGARSVDGRQRWRASSRAAGCCGRGRTAARTTARRCRRWSAAARGHGRARSASRIWACCSSTSCPSSSAACSTRCASRSRPGSVTVARAAAHVTYPARVQLIAAMNPCRCGHLADAALACARAPKCAADYQGRVSGPLLDRIDLHVDVAAVSAADVKHVS